ncbi:MAG: hypothetical protein ACREC0_12310 [Methylocella sp.]
MTAWDVGCKRGGFSARGSLHAEFVADTEADEEQENRAEDGLEGGYNVEPGGKTLNVGRVDEVFTEAEDV